MRWATGAVNRGKGEKPKSPAPSPTSPVSTAESSAGRLGRILVDQGRIRDDQITGIVEHARSSNLRFGDAAVDLGLISRDVLEHALAAQFDYPFLEPGEGNYSEELVAAYRPFSKKGQALRDLRSRIMQQWGAGGAHALAVVGARPGEGSSYIAANLAVVFSQLGERTVIVDTDMSSGRLHRIFGAQNDVGLSALLVGRASLADVLVQVPLFRNLSLLPSGASPPNAAELLGRRELAGNIAGLRESFDVVILDAPPASMGSGAELAAASCGNALVVVRQNRSVMEDSESLAAALRAAGVSLIGSVVTTF